MYDLVVIGGGPGGYVGAICAARAGMKVLLVEKDSLGGTCLNRGCIPTKSLIHDSALLHAARSSSLLTGNGNLAVDSAKLLNRKRQVVQNMVHGVNALMKGHGIEVLKGVGELQGPGRARVRLKDGEVRQAATRNVLLATGSRPAVPAFIPVDGRLVQTTDEALDSEAIPDSIAIIGGGVIGIEMATFYLNLGCRVVLLELLEDILITEEAEVRALVRRLLRQRGAELHVKTLVEAVIARDERVTVAFREADEPPRAIEVDRVLVATGRAPVLCGIEDKNLGLAMEGRFIKVNDRFETSIPGVYAAGDLVGGLMLAHKASAEAEMAVAGMAGIRRGQEMRYVPRCIWGPVEIGAVGLSEEEAKANGRSVRVGRFHFGASGAAGAMGHGLGFTKVIGDAESGEILGVHIAGEHATELIGQAVLVMAMEGVMEDLATAVMPHPTVSETLREAALDWNGRAIHLPPKTIHHP